MALTKPLAYISFDNGVARRLRTQTAEEQTAEALQACQAVGLGATLLSDTLAVRAICRRCSTSPGGWMCYELQDKAGD